MPELQPRQIHQERTEVSPARHGELQRTVPVGHHRRHRIPGCLQHCPPAEHPGATDQVGRLQHAAEIDPLHGNIGLRAELVAVQRVDLDRAGDTPSADAEADGVQEDAAIDDVHVGGETVERHVAALDLCSAIFQVHVGSQQLR